MNDPSRDIVLITIDCWRYDAPAKMSNFLETLDEFVRSDSITHAPATDGSIPGILCSRYYPQAYDEEGKVKSGIKPLPEILSEAGYSTAAFSAANPFLGKWAQYFDTFWNGDFSDPSDRNTIFQAGDYAARLLTLRQKFPAETVIKRAKGWYREQKGPRFLWIHLMDLHEPFHPGLKRGFSSGLLQSYRSLLEYRFGDERTEETLSESTQRQIERLYWDCVDKLDYQIEDIIDWFDEDTTIVITGDHGEEFDHGVYRHARLYDECVRVPLFIRTDLNCDFGGDIHRHLDLAPTLLRGLGIDYPDEWEGSTTTEVTRPAFLLSHVPQLSKFYAGLRTNEFKLINSYDEATGARTDMEFYEMHGDTAEQQEVTSGPVEEYQSNVDEFLKRIDVDIASFERNPIDTVEQRLHELGYTE